LKALAQELAGAEELGEGLDESTLIKIFESRGPEMI
jgi:hypothetical protein